MIISSCSVFKMLDEFNIREIFLSINKSYLYMPSFFKVGLLFSLVFFVYFTGAGFAQQSATLSTKKEELNAIKSEIKKLEQEFNLNTRKEKKSIEVLENFNKQNFLLNKVINTIGREEKGKEVQINKIEKNIKSIEARIKYLKDNYARYLVYLYKYGSEDEITMILGSESFNQALIRYKYFNRISEQREKNLDELKEREKELNENQGILSNEAAQLKIIVGQKQAEQQELKQKIQNRKIYLASLKNNKEALKNEIELKRKSEVEIKGIIAYLIAEEKREAEALRKERELAELKRKSGITIDEKESGITSFTKSSSAFAAIKGKMLWPVDNGKIIRKFGEQKNIRLNTITLNYGIDIKTLSGKTVKAVLDGVVSSINWLPGYGSVIIITHKDNLRTVYGHLAEIYVSEQTKVSSGTPIGTVDESLEGSILHFEIWNERENQNPELWLR